jgi:hypothetical protein
LPVLPGSPEYRFPELFSILYIRTFSRRIVFVRALFCAFFYIYCRFRCQLSLPYVTVFFCRQHFM